MERMMRDGRTSSGFKALLAAGALSFSAASYAATGPLPPQGPGTADGTAYNGVEYGAEIDPGAALFVDPNIGGIQGPCRYVVVSPADPSSAWIPLNTEQEWSYYRAGVNSGSPPPYVTEFGVCCRPQTVTLCKGAAGGTVSETLPYMIQSQQQSLVATCYDQWGKTYTDTETWVCGATGSGSAADGVWSENGGGGGDTWGCSPNAYTSGCTAQCGGGSETIYNSCGNVQGTQSCNTQPCCMPNASTQVGSCSASCGGGNQVVNVYDSCGNLASSYSQACNTQACTPAPTCDINPNTESSSVSAVCDNGTRTQYIEYNDDVLCDRTDQSGNCLAYGRDREWQCTNSTATINCFDSDDGTLCQYGGPFDPYNNENSGGTPTRPCNF